MWASSGEEGIVGLRSGGVVVFLGSTVGSGVDWDELLNRPIVHSEEGVCELDISMTGLV